MTEHLTPEQWDEVWDELEDDLLEEWYYPDAVTYFGDESGSGKWSGDTFAADQANLCRCDPSPGDAGLEGFGVKWRKIGDCHP